VKILYFHQHFCTPKGSSGTRSYEFAKALIARGHEVTMVCGTAAHGGLDLPYDKKRGWLRGSIDGIDVIALPLSYSNQDGILKRCLTFGRFAMRSVKVALTESCDLVFATSTPLTAAVPGIVARWFRRKPFVFEVRDLWPELPKALGMKNPILLGGMSLLEWTAYHSCHAAVGLSPGIVEGILKRSRKDLPVAMIPNGCDLEVFHPRLREKCALPGVEDHHVVAGFTGAHGIANGLDAVLDVAGVLKARGNDQIRLAFIGDGKVKAALEQRAEREGLDNCLFYPPRSKLEIAQVTASLDIGLMVLKDVPAFYYGTSPNKFFDYVSSGLPVLNNYPGWLADLIEKNQCGVGVPPRDAKAFADALEQLSADFGACKQMGDASRRLAESSFSRNRLAKEFCEWLEGVGARKGIDS